MGAIKQSVEARETLPGADMSSAADCQKTAILGSNLPEEDYLCQVSETVSCGACCGLYNVADPGLHALTSMLEHRSLLFSEMEKTPANVDAFTRKIARHESQQRPFEDFHHCPFLGLIGQEQKRVGCLLHPAGNNGVDLRGLSFYGGMACRVYFCPATRLLPARYKRLLKNIAPGWHWYGLVVTEHELVSAILLKLEKKLAGKNLQELAGRTAFREALINLLGLKIDWPFRPAEFDTCCHHIFAPANNGRPGLDPDFAKTIDPETRTILESLGSRFESSHQFINAHDLLIRSFEKVLAAAGVHGLALNRQSGYYREN